VNHFASVTSQQVRNNKAKGLEARIVFLAHPAKLVNPEPFLSKHIKREDDSSKGYFSFITKKGFSPKELALPSRWTTYKEEELRYLAAEELRILYVAATRAEQALVISSSAKNNNKNPWGKLLEISNIEELNIQPLVQEETSLNVTEVNLSDYQQQTGEKSLWVQSRKEMSYDYWSPTKDKDYSQVVTIEREVGDGKSWGTIIHHVFEKVVKGHDVTAYIPSLLTKYEIPLEKEVEVWKAIDVLKQSDFYRELQAAESVLTEVPFMFTVTKGQPLYELIDSSETANVPYIVKGVIDLIYKIDGNWKIVDYKTDNPIDSEDFDHLRSFYHDQVLFYKKAWEEMAGEKVVSEKLFFVME
jgi:ATP-dependent helicase/nuclease subunit A